MTQQKQDTKTATMGKYRRMFLVIVAALFTFGGPYAVYVFANILNRNYILSVASGFGLFLIGLLLIWYLIKKKIIF